LFYIRLKQFLRNYKFLKKCNLGWFVWVVVNDGSTDNTDKIVQKIADVDNRVKYYKKQNSGVSDTRNLATEKSSGDYIAFLDADDIWCKNFYDQNLRNEIKWKEADIFSLILYEIFSH
jgi:glycosyltransferase involved in cell wall biosynthesis